MEQKKTAAEIIIGGIVLFSIGIFIAVRTSGSVSYSSSATNGPGSALSILIILAGLGTIGAGIIRMMGSGEDYEDYDCRPAEDFSERLAEERKPAPAPAPVPEAAKAEIPVVKKIVYCPYCGTAQKEDYMSCESCGAGRKK